MEERGRRKSRRWKRGRRKGRRENSSIKIPRLAKKLVPLA